MDEVAYQVGTAMEVRALHVMPGVEGPEGRLHAHDYRIELLVERTTLGEEGMVCDLDLLDGALSEIVESVRGRDLETIRPVDAEAVTVEIFARWAHDAMAAAVRSAGGEMLTVRVWESPVAFGGYRAPVG
ncbi:MAG TPA: 6-carboxytetrahydropterin synthase [Acidimicrobiales bacterium]|jgi:6-pyruvoyltetrahydropterin/6-carboxytetrahydropterin synthase|nr:6-carboxytetrahydropterin synthase [Acidimicrobiales bacterium]